IRLRLADTSGDAGQLLRDFVEKYAMPADTEWTSRQRANAWVQFSAEPYSLRNFGLAGLPLRDLQFAIGDSSVSSRYNLITDPDSLAARLNADLSALHRGEEQDPRERRRRLEAAGLDKRLLSVDGVQPGAPAERSAVLLAVAKAAGANRVRASRRKGALPCPALSGRTVEAALDEICRLYGCYWRVEGSTLLVRSRFWFLDDEAEPPASAVARWRSILGKGRVLPLEES